MIKAWPDRRPENKLVGRVITTKIAVRRRPPADLEFTNEEKALE